MTGRLPRDTVWLTSLIERDDKADIDQCTVSCVKEGFVRGLSVGGAEGVDRDGELMVEDSDGTKHTIKIIATHQYPIPEDTYTLLRADFKWKASHRYPDGVQYWAVGRRLSQQSFEKLSVFKITGWDEIDRLESPRGSEYEKKRQWVD